jgi:hypothetical protein
VGAYSRGFFSRGNDPLIQGAADAAALDLIVNLNEANEVASRRQARLHGIRVRQHAV